MKPVTEFRGKTVVATTDGEMLSPDETLEGENPEGTIAWNQGDVTLKEPASGQGAELPHTFPATSVKTQFYWLKKLRSFSKQRRQLVPLSGRLTLQNHLETWPSPMRGGRGGRSSLRAFCELMVEALSGSPGEGGPISLSHTAGDDKTCCSRPQNASS